MLNFVNFIRTKRTSCPAWVAAALVFIALGGCRGPAGPAGPSVFDGTWYTLTPCTTEGGTISPSVPVKVEAGNLQIFVVKPAPFYMLDSVTADGVRLQVLASPVDCSVKVLDVSKDMEVKAWFSVKPVYYGMKPVPAGSFLMGVDSLGKADGDVNIYGDTVHRVTLSAFFMDTTEVTQVEYLSLMGCNPSYFSGDPLLPVVNISWFDAALYCNARSKMEGRDTVYSYSFVEGQPGNGCTWLLDCEVDYSKKGYRLPTEAEWEYACRGGASTLYWWGNDTNGMGVRTWFFANSGYSTRPVATTLANAYGLYDMTGNVYEWCNDWKGEYAAGSVTDPEGPANGVHRVIRGGSWFNDFFEFPSASRSIEYPSSRYDIIGFRCVLPQ